jgi:hypothetical protein
MLIAGMLYAVTNAVAIFKVINATFLTPAEATDLGVTISSSGTISEDDVSKLPTGAMISDFSKLSLMFFYAIGIVGGVLEIFTGTYSMRDFDNPKRLQIYFKLGLVLSVIFVCWPFYNIFGFNAVMNGTWMRNMAVGLILPVLFTIGSLLAIKQTPADYVYLPRPKKEGLKALIRK